MKGTAEPVLRAVNCCRPLAHGTQPGDGIGDSPDVVSSRIVSLGSVPDLHRTSEVVDACSSSGNILHARTCRIWMSPIQASG